MSESLLFLNVALRDVLVQNARKFCGQPVARHPNLVRGKPLILGNALEEVGALKDVSLEIRREEAVGTGSHPELTGRENIYLNGACLGLANEADI